MPRLGEKTEFTNYDLFDYNTLCAISPNFNIPT
jgi:hypothetical protein